MSTYEISTRFTLEREGLTEDQRTLEIVGLYFPGSSYESTSAKVEVTEILTAGKKPWEGSLTDEEYTRAREELKYDAENYYSRKRYVDPDDAYDRRLDR